MKRAIFVSQAPSKRVLQRWSWIAGVLLAVLPLGIASCNPTENAPAPETQETSAADANAVKVVKDFGPTLLQIGTKYSISFDEYANSLRASRYGFVDLGGKIVIEPQWSEISGFSEGIASGVRNGEWGWTDKTGQLFQPPALSSRPNFHEGLSAFERDGKWGYMDAKGTVVIQPEWEKAEDFNGGYAGVTRGGKWGGIDKTGRLVTPLGRYDRLYFAPEVGLWQMTVGMKTGFMDRAGRVVITPQWDDGVFWREGVGLVFRERKGGFIDKTGKVIVPPKWEDISPFSEGLAPVKQNGKWGFIDKTGKVVIELQWENATRFIKGLAGVQGNGKWGFIDKTGKVVIELRWEQVGDLGRELVLVREKKKYGFIDRTGRVVIEPLWDTADYYWETQYVMSALGEDEAIYWLVAREEKPELLQDKPANGFQSRSRPTVRALWLDSSGKQIWSSDNANSSTGQGALKSPSPSVSPGQANQPNHSVSMPSPATLPPRPQ